MAIIPGDVLEARAFPTHPMSHQRQMDLLWMSLGIYIGLCLVALISGARERLFGDPIASLKTRTAELDSLNRKIREQEDALNQLKEQHKQALRERETEIRTQKETLAQQDQRIQAQDARFADQHDEIKDLRDRLAVADRTTTEMRAELDDRGSHLDRAGARTEALEHHLVGHRRDIQRLEVEKEGLQDELEELRSQDLPKRVEEQRLEIERMRPLVAANPGLRADVEQLFEELRRKDVALDNKIRQCEELRARLGGRVGYVPPS
ncbi:hypothetical protein M501DRAFT_266473 [Patellaria atrata CBS 101060]|uniref:Uncharacterized protein n=1 Tax=Patellaria atrata CBS 101060 TaxID=1346257 RepID=A0A9P4S752_9PEZI|nr:hypothetical protein M501DRAFT_266473 [Patellaria atrata CBS 101060]